MINAEQMVGQVVSFMGRDVLIESVGSAGYGYDCGEVADSVYFVYLTDLKVVRDFVMLGAFNSAASV
jgi:hypothetical protein